MITKFDSLFAGHVDIENVGYGGVPVNERPYPNEHPASVFDKAQAMATLMDQPGNRELFEEQVDLIFKAFNNESFAHEGKHYTIPARVPYRGYDLKELTVVPRPLRLPVECWQPIQGGSGRALEFMAKHSIQGLVGGGSAEGGAMHGVVMAWQEAHARRGMRLDLGERLCFGF